MAARGLVRGAFAKLTAADVTRFTSIVGAAGVLTEQAATQKFTTDWLQQHTAAGPTVVVQPRTTEEVSAVLRHCNERCIAVVPQGGNTGLVAGGVPVFDEVILSLTRMAGIRHFDADVGIITADAGVTIDAADAHLKQHGHIFPLDLASKGSCTIGGAVACNAGGIRVLRYGSLRGTVLGVEAVLADGTVVSTLRRVRKDNALDTTPLFIGSEGILGVVTAASVLAAVAPVERVVFALAFRTFPAVLDALRRARASLGEILSAFEVVDAAAIGLCAADGLVPEAARADLTGAEAKFVVLVEAGGSRPEDDERKVDAFMEAVLGDGLAVGGMRSENAAQADALWRVREAAPMVLPRRGWVYKYDISLPLPDYYAPVEELRARLAGTDAVVVGFGHVADGNLHLNCVVPGQRQRSAEVQKACDEVAFGAVRRYGGSISAEHGVGLFKRTLAAQERGAGVVATLRAVKAALDPRGILNPYKVV